MLLILAQGNRNLPFVTTIPDVGDLFETCVSAGGIEMGKHYTAPFYFTLCSVSPKVHTVGGWIGIKCTEGSSFEAW